MIPAKMKPAISEIPARKRKVLIAHGIGEHSGLYSRLACALLDEFDVYAMDYAGHGQSEGNRLEFKMENLVEDFVLFSRLCVQEHDEVYAFGHSLGGAVIILALQTKRLPGNVKAAVLSAPAVNFNVPTFVIPALQWIGGLFPGLRVLKIDAEVRSKRVADVIAKDWLMSRERIPFSSLRSIFDAFPLIRLAAKDINVPVLVIQGDQDSVIPIADLERFFADIPFTIEKLLVLIKDGLHDTVLEEAGYPGSGMDAVVDWLKAR